MYAIHFDSLLPCRQYDIEPVINEQGYLLGLAGSRNPLCRPARALDQLARRCRL